MAFQVTWGKGGVSTSQTGGITAASLDEAQRTGKMNLVARGLEEISDEILGINERKAEEGAVSFAELDTRVKWYERVPVSVLVLSSNSIKEIPDGISKLDSLVTLNCGANEIAAVSPQIGQLTNLTTLSLATNCIPSLPPEMGGLSLLTALKLDSNQLTELGDWIGGLVCLQSLSARGNKLASVSPCVGALQKLTTMDLSHNQLETLPDALGGLSALTELLCFHNKLHFAPDLSGMTSLQHLDLSLNRLDKFPLLPRGLALKDVNLAINKIPAIPPDSLAGLCGLSSLQLSENSLSSLPDAIASLSQLQKLDCSNNNLTRVPYHMGHMSLLQLNLQGNMFKDLKPEMLSRNTGEVLAYLVSKIPIEEMPQGATPLADATHPLEPHLKDGRIVKLNGKGWEEIPADVVSPLLCAEAKEVDLSKNKLSAVPDEFFSSIRLAEGLHLQFNRLSQLPLGLCGLQSLKLLQLFNNQLSDLPDQLSELSSLIDIRIGFNRFTQLPKVLYQMPALTAIVADNNDIAAVDAASLQQLQNLSALDLSNNAIMALPPKLALCPSLRSLGVQGNLFKVPGNQLLDQGSAALLDWLRGRIPQ